MTMTSGWRKFALTAHVTSSVGLLGSIAAFLALAIAGLTSQNAQTVRGAYLATELTAEFVIVPLAFASLLTGLIQSLGTPWGLFRHYWVLLKLLLTVLVTIVLLVQLEPIGHAARLAAKVNLSRADLRAVGSSGRETFPSSGQDREHDGTWCFLFCGSRRRDTLKQSPTQPRTTARCAL